LNPRLTQQLIEHAVSAGAHLAIIVGPQQLEQLAEQAPGQFKGQFERLYSEECKDLQTAVYVGVYGYDEDFAYHKKQPQGVGATGIHQNYLKLSNDIGKDLLQFLEKRGFAGYGTGEGMLPVKYILNKVGVGKYGKNSLIYVDNCGSYINNWFELFTNAPLKPTHAPVAEGSEALSACEKCNACIVRCPTQAIVEPYTVVMSRCITHLTHRATFIPQELRGKISNWIWGCNACQNVCPVNARVIPRKKHAEAQIHHPGPTGLPPAHKHPFPKLAGELDPSYDQTYLQNVLIALGNTGTANDVFAIDRFYRTPKGLELKEHCDYALKRIKERHA